MTVQIKRKNGHVEIATHVDRAEIDKEEGLEFYIQGGTWFFPSCILEKIEITMGD